MATRLKLHHQDDIRAKIQAGALIDYLQCGIFGEKYKGKDVTLTSEKVAAVRVLLNKTLPDLHKSEHSGPGGGPIPVLTADMSPEQAAAAYKAVMGVR